MASEIIVEVESFRKLRNPCAFPNEGSNPECSLTSCLVSIKAEIYRLAAGELRQVLWLEAGRAKDGNGRIACLDSRKAIGYSLNYIDFFIIKGILIILKFGRF